MNISELSIRRPVLATVLTVIILLFGLIGYTTLGVREYPSVDNPIISVTCSYPGANAEVIENQITEPLEQNINGIPGIRSLSSTSQQGQSRITVEFELSVDLETAANDVRDKVSRAQRYLPRDCDPPTVSKADADASPILMVAIQSNTRSLLELSEIADLTVKEQLQTIPDVSSVSIWGEKRYSMRLWLDPVKMAGYGITPVDVKNAIDEQNLELPSGSIEGNTVELTLRTMGLMHTAKEFNNVILKEDNGRIIRVSDIGYAELGPADLKSYMKMNGVPMVGVVVIPQPGANHIEIADAVYERMEQMEKDLPDDVTYTYGFDNTRFIRASIAEVESTVYEAFVLVIIIIFLFLRDWRVTLIPCIVIPVSLIGAFFVMYVAGFSINVLTMLAVVLSVGLVVDDAIVMTENIYIRIERGMRPFEAGIEGAKEIFFAVVSTTITLAAVFLPIVFMEGTSGRLFREFSFVVAGSVIISAFAALTFTPMLATKMLKYQEKKNWFYRKTEPFFEGMNNLYSRSLKAFLRRRVIAIPIVAVTMILIGILWSQIPSEMAPLEDRSQITITTRAAEGTSYEYIRDYTEEINALVDSVIPDAAFVTARVSSGSGNIQITLKDIKDRDYTQMEVAEKMSQAIQKHTKARSFVRQQSSFGGRRSSMPVQYVLQAVSLEKLQEVLPEFLAQVYDNPTFQMADVDLKFSSPEMRVNINRDKAGTMGVNVRDIGETLQYGLSGQRMGYFYMNGKQYEILGQINRQQRNQPAHVKSIYIRNDKGEMIQMDNLVDFVEAVAPPKLYHYNRFVSATVSAGLAEGKTIGDGLDEMDKIAANVLDETFRTALSGDSKDYRESSSSLMFAFIFALVLIYLILSAQFESFKDPLVIMLTVPLAIAGALIFMYFADITMNIFSQIGIIMLIGLVAKNGILIVEFANQKQEMGEDKMQAIRDAALQRLRPILMTSAATVLGLVPLAFATGEGANQRIAMGTAVVGGMLVSTFLTMYIVPAIYSYISTNRSSKKNKA
ncbi:MAG TPA: efflux RND transporter permease subunit [Candidatus Phocaeicola excrementigallinarum]|nr:efflux RND transporter permease subunit [Candidatus Phocaeicola excrementigallinarum]